MTTLLISSSLPPFILPSSSHKTRMPAEEEWVVGPHRFEAGANQLYSSAALGYEGADLHKASLVLLGGGGRGAGAGGGGAGGGKGKEKERGGLNVYIVLRPCVDEEGGGGGGKEGGKEGGEVHAQVTMLSLEPKAKTGGGAGGGGGGGGGEGKEDVWVARVVKQKIQVCVCEKD
jgi:hypothetical protein